MHSSRGGQKFRNLILSSPVGPTLRKAKRRISPPLNDLRRRGELVAADVLDILGIGHETEVPLPRQWAKVLHRSRDTLAHLPAADSQRILFATSHGFTPYMIACETTLATSLRLRGAQPHFLVCDHALPACEFNCWGNWSPDPGEFAPGPGSPYRADNCESCTNSLLGVLDQFDYPIIRFIDFVEPDDLVRLQAIVDGLQFDEYGDFTYKGIPVGEQARASVVRSLRRGTLEATPYTHWLFKRYLLAALFVVDLGERILDRVQPDCLGTVHGVYVTHGTLCELARRRGVRVVVWAGAAYRRHTMVLSHDETYHRSLVTMPRSEWDRGPLTAEQEARLDSYVDSKRFGGQDQISYHLQAVEDRTRFIEELGLDLQRPIVSLFTNVLWDAQILYSSNAFANQLDWIFTTIHYFSCCPDLQLVIRVHPSEARGIGTNQPVVQEIEARFPKLPENIIIVRPESHLSSYTLADMSQAALIYGTNMGLEVAVRGVPVIVAGEASVRGKGFTYDASSREEYLALLDQIMDLPHNSSEMVERARRFAYHFYFRCMVDFPQVHVKNPPAPQGLRLRFRHLSDLAPGNNPSLDAICDGILHGSDFAMD